MSAGTLTAAQVRAGNYAASHFTPAQGRVLYHQERIFRSTGGGIHAHFDYVMLCRDAGLPDLIPRWTPAQCVLGLQLIERAARGRGLHHFRDVGTQWAPLAAALAASHPDQHRVTEVAL